MRYKIDEAKNENEDFANATIIDDTLLISRDLKFTTDVDTVVDRMIISYQRLDLTSKYIDDLYDLISKTIFFTVSRHLRTKTLSEHIAAIKLELSDIVGEITRTGEVLYSTDAIQQLRYEIKKHA